MKLVLKLVDLIKNYEFCGTQLEEFETTTKNESLSDPLKQVVASFFFKIFDKNVLKDSTR